MNQEELLKAGKRIGELLEACLHNTNFGADKPSRLAANLLLSIAELYEGVLTLLGSRAQTHAPVLVRSIQEALVNLKCLKADRGFVNSIAYEDSKQNIKTIEGFFASGVIEEPEQVKHWKQILQNEYRVVKEMKEHNVKCFYLSDKFKLAGMSDQYKSTYGFMCSVTHNNLTTLIARHGYSHELKFFEGFPEATLKGILKMSVGIYAQAVEVAPAFSDVREETVKNAFDDADKLFLDIERDCP